MRSDPRIRIFPEYFDSALTRHEGRRVSKKLSFDNPSLNELKIAGQKLGYEVDLDPEKAYSRQWSNPRGMIYLSSADGDKITVKKTKILKDLSKTVTEFARPQIKEFVRRKEQQLKEKKSGSKQSKKPIRKQDRKGQKPSRRRR